MESDKDMGKKVGGKERGRKGSTRRRKNTNRKRRRRIVRWREAEGDKSPIKRKRSKEK